MRYSIVLAVSFILIIPAIGFSATIIVPDDYPTIQGAIDASVNGDTVLVKPGIYVENIEFKGKPITVKSSDGPKVTLIDGHQTGAAATFKNNEELDSILQGFSLINGSGFQTTPYVTYGGGIYCSHASPTIQGNTIMGNTAAFGGAIACSSSSSAIIDNTITGNAAKICGGIYCVQSSSPTIMDNEISGNTSLSEYDIGGGGISCTNLSSPMIFDNIINDNVSNYGGGGICCTGSLSPTINDNTISGNLVKTQVYGCGGGIHCLDGSAPIIMSNLISKNTISINSPVNFGGGICCMHSSSPTIQNNTIAENTGKIGGGIYCETYMVISENV